jgi:putative N-acetylmannosamine-6-phosphate epimerase
MHEEASHHKCGLIVSCQELDDEPLHSSFIMGRMVLAALGHANTLEKGMENNEIVGVGCEIVALDATDRPHFYGISVDELLQEQ